MTNEPKKSHERALLDSGNGCTPSSILPLKGEDATTLEEI